MELNNTISKSMKRVSHRHLWINQLPTMNYLWNEAERIHELSVFLQPGLEKTTDVKLHFTDVQ